MNNLKTELLEEFREKFVTPTDEGLVIHSIDKTFDTTQDIYEFLEQAIDKSYKQGARDVIEDIPSKGIVIYKDIENNESPRFDIQLLRNQLTNKYLKDES